MNRKMKMCGTRKLSGILFLLMLWGGIFAGCSGAGGYIDVSYYGSQSGSMNLVFDTEETGILSYGNERKVILTEPSRDINPWTALNGGDFYVTTDSEDKMATYGNIAYTTAKLPDGETTLQTFSHIGEEKICVGSDFDGRIWCIKGGGTPALAAESAYRTVVMPDGEKRTLLMCKGDMTGGRWIGNSGGKILRDSGGERVESIGFVSWRLIKIESGSYMSIMMTKTLDSGAKWQGRFNGVLYVDK